MIWSRKLEEAKQRLETALTSGDLIRQVEAHFQVAEVYQEREDWESALLHLEKTLELNDRLGDERGKRRLP